jgi:hypothetical protein
MVAAPTDVVRRGRGPTLGALSSSIAPPLASSRSRSRIRRPEELVSAVYRVRASSSSLAKATQQTPCAAFTGTCRALERRNERRRAACLPIVACGTEDNCPHGGWCSAAALRCAVMIRTLTWRQSGIISPGSASSLTKTLLNTGLMSERSQTCATGSQAGTTTSPSASPQTLPTMKPQTNCDQRRSLLLVQGTRRNEVCSYRLHGG